MSAIAFTDVLAADLKIPPLTIGDLTAQEAPFAVMAFAGVGLYIPAYSSDSVSVGHYDETFDYLNKTQTALAVLTGKEDIEQFLSSNDIRYVVWTVDLQTPPPAVLGPPAYDTPDFKIWRVF